MCLDDQILNTYLDGELAEPWKSQVEEHLSYCPSCKQRYESLKQLRAVIKKAELTDIEIEPHKERVMAILEKNYLSKNKKKTIFHKQLKLTVSQLAGVAAAFVIVFVGSWSVLGSKSEQIIPAPEATSVVDIANLTPVKTYEPSTVKTLNNFTLEEILKNLDERGYDVDVRLKGITPLEPIAEVLETEEPVEEVSEENI